MKTSKRYTVQPAKIHSLQDIMLELAKHYGKGPTSIAEIAKNQEIPIKYLEQLIIPLKKAGLVEHAPSEGSSRWRLSSNGLREVHRINAL